MSRVVHFIRHGQSTFNEHFAATGKDPMQFDPRLTELGHRQVKEASTRLANSTYDVVITSPLTRAIQTTRGIFGDRFPIVITPLHREWLQDSCDVGRTVKELSTEFPDLDFAGLDDPWWHHQEPLNEHGFSREPEDVLQARISDFKQMIAGRQEKRIAVIGHADFFQRLLNRHLQNCELAEWQPTA